jgi:xylan 1,4-beta-xylosidase
MITLPGIPKPTFHAYRILAALGDRLLARTDGAVVTADAGTGRVAALAYHYPAEEPRSVPASFDSRDLAVATQAKGTPRQLSLSVAGVGAGTRFAVEVLDAEHGDAIGAWRALGEPAEPTREQLADLDRCARATGLSTVAAGADGTVRLDRTMAPWSVVLLRQLG